MYVTWFQTKLMQVDKIEIGPDNEVIKMDESQKLLGVLIDKHLTWIDK